MLIKGNSIVRSVSGISKNKEQKFIAFFKVLYIVGAKILMIKNLH